MLMWCTEAMAEASRRQAERDAAAIVSTSVDVLPPATSASTESPHDAATADAAATAETAPSSVPALPVPGPMMPPNMLPPHMMPGT